MQPTVTLCNAVLWITLTAFSSCYKDATDTYATLPDFDPETAPIPSTFQQNVLFHGFTSTQCSVCPVMSEKAKEDYRNFKGRMSVLILHRDALASKASDSVFRFFNVTGVPSWYYFPVLPDSGVFLTMTQKFGIALKSIVRGDSCFLRVITAFCDDISTTMKLAVWLTEDSITGSEYAQEVSYNANLNLPFYHLVRSLESFRHDHVLRKVISGSVFGDPIDPTRTTAGVRDIKEYAFALPENSDPEHLKIIAFAYTGVHLYGMVNNVAEAKPGETVLWN